MNKIFKTPKNYPIESKSYTSASMELTIINVEQNSKLTGSKVYPKQQIGLDITSYPVHFGSIYPSGCLAGPYSV